MKLESKHICWACHNDNVHADKPEHSLRVQNKRGTACCAVHVHVPIPIQTEMQVSLRAAKYLSCALCALDIKKGSWLYSQSTTEAPCARHVFDVMSKPVESGVMKFACGVAE